MPTLAKFAGRYDENLLFRRDDDIVKAVTSASVRVLETGTSTETTLYTDRTKSTTVAQPISPDANGNLEFFANPGTYDVEVSIDGTVRSTNSVVVQPDGTEALNSIDQVFNVKDYGAVGDGATDDTTAIQDALDAAIDDGGGIVFVPSGIYKISGPLTVTARVNLVGAGAGGANTGTPARLEVDATAWGVQDDRAVVECGSYYDFVSQDWWHWGRVEGLVIDCNNAAEFGVAVWSMGEESVFRRVTVNRPTGAGFLLAGDHAVGQIEDCSANSGTYGFAFQDHPDPTFPDSGNSGTVRCFGISGDNNATAHVRINGGHQLHFAGIKSEGHETVFLFDAGAGIGVGGGRAKVYIDGRCDGLTSGIDMIKITGGRPSILMGPIHAPNFTNIINDTVASETLAMVASGYGLTYYGRDGDDRIHFDIPTVVVDGSLETQRTGTILQGTTRARNTKTGNNPVFWVDTSVVTSVPFLASGHAGAVMTVPVAVIKHGQASPGTSSDLLAFRNSADTDLLVVNHLAQLVFESDTNLYREAANVLKTDDVFKTQVAATASRPLASTVGVGAQMYDSDLSKPIWSDGTDWRDAAGTVV